MQKGEIRLKMKDRINIGIAGFGQRGQDLLKNVVVHHPQVEISVVCDVYGDRCEWAADFTEKSGRKRPKTTQDYREMLQMPEIDAILLCTAWSHHIDICVEAMEAGKYVACEVGGAYSVRDCWKLVEAYEKTGVPVMLMENCVYGRDEMMVSHMAELGALGKIVHCEGGYRHDLREEVAFGEEKRHYRLNNYIHRNTENYPTHELGPIAKLLNINRGNRMLTLTSVASKAEGMKEYLKEHKPDDETLLETQFNQGDVVNTIITCANGETILLTLDTTLPRFYSRGFTVQGTKGMYFEDNQSLFLDGEEHAKDHFSWKKHWGNVEEYREKYEHPVWKKYLNDGLKGSHGGMDWLVFCEFVESVRNGSQVPIDVYDMAAWMSISALAEESIAMGGHPVAIPDFTSGAWINRK